MAQNLDSRFPIEHEFDDKSLHFTLMVLIAEIVFVTLLSILSDMNAQMNTIVTAFLLALWLVFIVINGEALVTNLKWSNAK